MFEVITSEASYLKSINILIWHFAHSPKLRGEPAFEDTNAVLTKRDHKTLFSDIFAVNLKNKFPLLLFRFIKKFDST